MRCSLRERKKRASSRVCIEYAAFGAIAWAWGSMHDSLLGSAGSVPEWLARKDGDHPKQQNHQAGQQL
jgi:hypothetical protein